VSLNFKFPELILDSKSLEMSLFKMEMATKAVSDISDKVGKGSDAFKAAKKELDEGIANGDSFVNLIKSKLHVRAFSSVLQEGIGRDIRLSSELLAHISVISPNPGTVLIESIQRYYFNNFLKLKEQGLLSIVCEWLRWAYGVKEKLTSSLIKILSPDSAVWIAQSCVDKGVDFESQLKIFDIESYKGGELLSLAQKYYFVKKLETIEVNKPNPILREIQRKEVYNSVYQNDCLLGHEILKIILSRAPSRNLDDSWMNVIMSIAGDPRISKSHPNYRKWWSQIPQQLVNKVHGWLSKLDLKLFLKALEGHAKESYDDELQRMYPSRKHFLYGLDDKDLVLNTRLFLSNSAEQYLLKNYKREHLPSYSKVSDGNKSLIYVEMDQAHIVEGTHSCYLWIYASLDDTADVKNYSKSRFTYSDLTSGMNSKMAMLGCESTNKIQHNPANYNWQKNQ